MVSRRALLAAVLLGLPAAGGQSGSERLQAVKCDEKHLKIDVSSAVGQTFLTRKLRNRAMRTLAGCGVVVLKGAFAKEHIARLAGSAERQLGDFFERCDPLPPPPPHTHQHQRSHGRGAAGGRRGGGRAAPPRQPPALLAERRAGRRRRMRV